MKDARYVLIGFILAGILAAGVLLAKKQQGAPPVVLANHDLKSKGPKDALVQIVEYSDFECPACAKAEEPINKIFSDPEFQGKIRFMYRHFPLSGHRWSGLAHQAAECANQQGKFWEYHDKLYSEQSLWSGMESPTETFLSYAKEFNLKTEPFGFCLADPEIRSRVLEEKKKGEALQIRSTPTFFINGERLVGPIEFEKRAPAMIRKILGLPEKLEIAETVPVAAAPNPDLQGLSAVSAEAAAQASHLLESTSGAASPSKASAAESTAKAETAAAQETTSTGSLN